MDRIEVVPIADLVLDWSLYVRHEVDAVQITRLMDALAAGNELPPIIVDRKSRRVVDGVHRYTATHRTQGDGATIAVIRRTYADETALILEAIALNSRHGVPMESIDQRHCIQLATQWKVPLDRLAVAMAMPLDRLEVMRRDSFATGPDGLVILKVPTRSKFKGGKMTRRQVAVNDKLLGMQPTYYPNITAAMLEEEMFDLGDPAVVASLLRLEAALANVAPGLRKRKSA